jgi:hypothetical protein
MALEFTEAITEMSTIILPGGKGKPARKADNFLAICEPTVYKMWEPRHLTTIWASTACYKVSFINSKAKLHAAQLCIIVYKTCIFSKKSVVKHIPLLNGTNVASTSKFMGLSYWYYWLYTIKIMGLG